MDNEHKSLKKKKIIEEDTETLGLDIDEANKTIMKYVFLGDFSKHKMRPERLHNHRISLNLLKRTAINNLKVHCFAFIALFLVIVQCSVSKT